MAAGRTSGKMVELNWLLFFFLFLYIGQSAFGIWVERINTVHASRRGGEVPPGFEEFLDESKLARINAYTNEKSRFGIYEEIASEGVLLAIVFSGLLPLLARWTGNLGWSAVPAGLFFFFVPGLIQFLVALPFDYHHSFGIEQKFGFNRSTLTLWIVDHLKSGLVNCVLFAGLLSVLLLIIEHSPRYWWLWGFLAVLAVQFLLAVLYPVAIAPLFNRFEPVRDEELAQKITALMDENGIRVKKILQMDAGKRSGHTNAYFTGIGKTKQIVLFDTLLASHTREEILSVLAHEAGHYRKKHVLKQLAVFGVLMLAGFYLTYLFLRWPLLYSTFGFGAPLPFAGLFLAGIFWRKAGFFVRPLYTGLSRRFEEEADLFAVGMLQTAAPMISALKRLAADNLSNLVPHPLYVRFHYSHPPIVERVARLEDAQHFLGNFQPPSPERFDR